MFKPLRIRAYPRSGIISDQYLPLDGILYYHLVRKIFGEQVVSKPGESVIKEYGQVKLPLKQTKYLGDGEWFYKVSFAQWSNDVIEDNSFKVKQSDFVRFQKYLNQNKKISVSGGKYKSYHIKIYYRHASFVQWYCMGAPYQIAELLRFCTHIGKNSGDGWGEVARWEIQDWPEDWSVRGPEDQLMRAIPRDNGKFLYGIRPSYWEPKHIFPVKMPDEK